MSSTGLFAYVDQPVLCVLQDGRVLHGDLAGFDPRANVLLARASERLFRGPEQPALVDPLGLYLVKGDHIAMVALVDPALDQPIDDLYAEPLLPVRHQ